MGFFDQISYKGPGGQTQTLGNTQGLDLTQKQNRRSIWAPMLSAAAMYRSPEMQQYMNQEQTVLPMYMQSMFQGGNTAGREAGNLAASRGLGRGAATQLQTGLRQNTMGGVAQALMAARVGDLQRRAAGIGGITSAIQNAQQSLYMRNKARRARVQGIKDSVGGLAVQAGMAGLGAFTGGLGLGAAGSIFPGLLSGGQGQEE